MRNLLNELRQDTRAILGEAYLKEQKEAFMKHQHRRILGVMTPNGRVGGQVNPEDRVSVQKRCFECGHINHLRTGQMKYDGSFHCDSCDKDVCGKKEAIVIDVTKNFKIIDKRN